MTEAQTFREWLASMPMAWREAFARGRQQTREQFAAEEENLDEIARHVKAAREIGAGTA